MASYYIAAAIGAKLNWRACKVVPKGVPSPDQDCEAPAKSRTSRGAHRLHRCPGEAALRSQRGHLSDEQYAAALVSQREGSFGEAVLMSQWCWSTPRRGRRVADCRSPALLSRFLTQAHGHSLKLKQLADIRICLQGTQAFLVRLRQLWFVRRGCQFNRQ